MELRAFVPVYRQLDNRTKAILNEITNDYAVRDDNGKVWGFQFPGGKTLKDYAVQASRLAKMGGGVPATQSNGKVKLDNSTPPLDANTANQAGNAGKMKIEDVNDVNKAMEYLKENPEEMKKWRNRYGY